MNLRGLFVCGLLAGLAAAGTPWKAFPQKATVAGKTVLRNGVGLCEWGLFNWDLYHGALYLEKRTRSANTAIKAGQAKRIRLHFSRKLTKKQLSKAWTVAFEYSATKQISTYRKRLDALNGMMRTVKKGETMTFDMAPQGPTTVRIAGKKVGTIEGADFAEMFVRLYLGKYPPDKNLKKAMLRGK